MFVFIFCSRDYLNITYEHDQKSKVYCGNKTGWRVEVAGNYIMIKFHSDGSQQKRGFLINFTAIPHREYYCFFGTRERYCFSLDQDVLYYCITSILLLSPVQSKLSWAWIALFLCSPHSPPPPPPTPCPFVQVNLLNI